MRTIEGMTPAVSPAEARAEVERRGRAQIVGVAADLLESNVALRSLQVGEQVPDGELLDLEGRTLGLRDLLNEGPLVLGFHPGRWCSFSSELLRTLDARAAKIHELGASIAAVSSQTVASSRKAAERMGLGFALLSDPENALGRGFGLAYDLPEELRWAYRKLGVDLPAYRGGERFELLVPATYVITPSGEIVSRFVQPDARARLELSDVLSALEKEQAA